MSKGLPRIIYSVEGNIGSGKTTLLSIIKNTMQNVNVIPEPVAQWQNISTKYNLLQKYYEDPHRWAFTFQANALLSRMTELTKLLGSISQNCPSQYFTERSIIADKQIFAKLLYNQKKMNDMEYQLYQNMYHSLDNLFKTPKAHKYIYLRTSPALCYERMKKRNRSEQQSIPLDYFKEIHMLHEEWLLNNKDALVIDGQKQFESCQKRSGQILQTVESFF